MRPITAKQYREYVNKAQKMVKLRHELKYEIAKIAIKVCDNTDGGSVGQKSYTLTKFSKDIGMSYHTLAGWRREYLKVVSKIDDVKPKRYALNATLKKVHKDTPPPVVKRIYRKELKKVNNPENSQLADAVMRLNTIDFMINQSFILKKVNQDHLVEIRKTAKKIVSGIDDHFNGTCKKKTRRNKAVKKAAKLLRT